MAARRRLRQRYPEADIKSRIYHRRRHLSTTTHQQRRVQVDRHRRQPRLLTR